MRSYSAAELGAISPRDFDDILAAIAPLVPVRGGGLMHLVWFTALAIRGGQDVTDSVPVRARRLLHAAAEDRAARDFLADVERRPAP